MPLLQRKIKPFESIWNLDHLKGWKPYYVMTFKREIKENLWILTDLAEYKYLINKDGLWGIDSHQTTAPHLLLATIL